MVAETSTSDTKKRPFDATDNGNAVIAKSVRGEAADDVRLVFPLFIVKKHVLI